MFRHSTPLIFRFSDMDSFGHINNANYLTYLEEARIKYFDEIVKWNYDWSKNGIILARIEIDYKIPGYFKDTVLVYTRCSAIGTKSISLENEIVKIDQGNERLLAKAKVVLVMYNYETNTSIPVPSAWRAAVNKFEQQAF